MIRVRYDRARGLLAAEGHADSAPWGRDLICAAVSALLYTAAEAARRLDPAGPPPLLEPGRARVTWPPDAPGARPALDAVCGGFALLAAQYPAHVRYQEGPAGQETG